MKKIVAHNGNFHADDIFAVAALLILFPDSTVIRTRDKSIIETADIVVDVGGIYDPLKYRFDHHQFGGAGKRANGIPYAAFGLVWKEFGERVSGSPEGFLEVDTNLVASIDANDNGYVISSPLIEDVNPYTIEKFLGSFVDSNVTDDAAIDTIFFSLIPIAKELIEREVKNANSKIEAAKEVLRIYESTDDKQLILLDKPMSWKSVLTQKPEPLFVVYPANNGWHVQAVPLAKNGFTTRKSFPATWAGKIDNDLAEITGVVDAVFCHNTGFLAVSKTKEGALALAKLALNA